jgi:hypothetical protein
MGAPVFFGYWIYSLHSRILPNRIAAVIPMFCPPWPTGTSVGGKVRAVGGWLAAGMILGRSPSCSS